ncbi:PAS domain-containing sensor histidine kinase [Roseospira navarrensis]|nr:PAS domain-containing sensor histidine kinase [Roseospira navarrensis]
MADSPALILDAAGTVTHANPAAIRLFGGASGALVGTIWTDTVVAPASGDEARWLHREIMAGHRAARQASLSVKGGASPLGRIIWLGTVLRDAGGRITGALMVGEPDPDGAVLETLGNVAQMRAMLDNTRVGIVIVRPGPEPGSRVIRLCNRRILDILGYEAAEDLIGRSVDTFHVSKEAADHFGRTFFSSLTNHEQLHIEYQLRHRDGHPVWCLMSGKAIDQAMPADLAKGVIWVVDDLTDRKALEGALVAAREQAEAASQAKSHFLASMSHELRTPLNAILGFSDVMREQSFGCVPPPYLEYADSIHRSGKHLLDIINQILDLAKIEAGRVDLLIGHHPMRSVVDDAFELLGPSAAAKGLDLLNQTHCLHDIQFDRVRMRQALINVVGNAIKFTPRGHVVVRNSCSGGWHGLVIEDTGPGMTADEIQEALQPFGQVGRDSMVRGADGTGLGLTVTRQIMRLHRGDMVIESVKGRGTTVTLLIPEDLGKRLAE